MSASFFAPMPRSARTRPSFAARSRSSSVRIPSSRYKRGDGLGADALQVEQIENGRRELGQELPMKGRAAGFGDLANSGSQILPDAWNLAQPRFVEQSELVRMVHGDVGAVAIRANLERVVALDLQEIGNLPEDARDRQVIQAGGRPSRCDSRARALRRRRGRRRWRAGPTADRSRRGSRRRRRRIPWRRSRPRPRRARSGPR